MSCCLFCNFFLRCQPTRQPSQSKSNCSKTVFFVISEAGLGQNALVILALGCGTLAMIFNVMAYANGLARTVSSEIGPLSRVLPLQVSRTRQIICGVSTKHQRQREEKGARHS